MFCAHKYMYIASPRSGSLYIEMMNKIQYLYGLYTGSLVMSWRRGIKPITNIGEQMKQMGKKNRDLVDGAQREKKRGEKRSKDQKIKRPPSLYVRSKAPTIFTGTDERHYRSSDLYSFFIFRAAKRTYTCMCTCKSRRKKLCPSVLDSWEKSKSRLGIIPKRFGLGENVSWVQLYW